MTVQKKTGGRKYEVRFEYKYPDLKIKMMFPRTSTKYAIVGSNKKEDKDINMAAFLIQQYNFYDEGRELERRELESYFRTECLNEQYKQNELF